MNYMCMYFLLIAVVLQICSSLHLNSPNSCPKYVLTSSDQYTTTQQLVIECCADYYDDNGTCKECKSGLYGKNCLLPCLPNYYGVRCKQMCNCSSNKICDPQFGCVCKPGWIGQNCREECPVDTYGLNCNKTCWCANNARCDQETGKCICPPGWIGNNCTKECPKGYFGQDCNQRCTCPSNADCNHVSGECECHEGFTGKGCSDIDMIKVATSGQKKNVLSTERIITIVLSLVGLIALSTFFAWKYFRGKLNQNSEPEAEEIHYDEISLYHDINPQESIGQRNVTNEIEPTYVRQDRRLSVPNSLVVKKDQKTIFKGNSLLNLRNDDIYVNPYCTLLPYADQMQHFTVQFLTPRTRCRSAEYLNPYSVLNLK